MGARLVLDLNPSGSSSPQSMISIDGMLYFTADLGASGEGSLALLKSDGTEDGTKLIKEYSKSFKLNHNVEISF